MFPQLAYPILSKYADNLCAPSWAMDVRHIMILFNMLVAGSYKCVLEIGSHFGASTTAFVEAIEMGCPFIFHACDVQFQAPAIRLCEKQCEKGKIILHEEMSSDFLRDAPLFDFALLDGSHICEHVQNEFEYLSMHGISSIMLHDTMTQNLPESIDTPWFDGPMLLREKLLASPDWLCVEDCVDRINEETKRGLFFATRKISDYHNAVKCFGYWKQVPYEKLIATDLNINS